MIEINKLAKGIALFADNCVLPKMQDGSIEKKAVGIFAGLISRRGQLLLEGLQQNEWLKAMRVFDGNGNFDIDIMREILSEQVGSGYTMQLPKIPFSDNQTSLTFRSEDIDSLYNYIVNG